jgi:hypothetical protein
MTALIIGDARHSVHHELYDVANPLTLSPIVTLARQEMRIEAGPDGKHLDVLEARAALDRVGYGAHRRIVDDHASIDEALIRWKVSRRRAGSERCIDGGNVAVVAGAREVVKKLGLPVSAVIAFVVEIEGWDEDFLLQVGEFRRPEHLRKDFGEFVVVIVRPYVFVRGTSEPIVRVTTSKDFLTMFQVEIDETLRLQTVRQAERQNSACRRAGDHVHLR